MLTIHQFPPDFGLPVSVSQYCAKVEVYCRLTGREFTTAVGDVRKSPNKQVPYAEFGDGRIVCDSTEIIATLEKEGPSLDEGISDADRATGEEIEKACEESLYYACLYSRFVEPAGWEFQKGGVKAIVPWILSPILVPIIRSSQKKRCAQNGFSSEADYGPSIALLDRIDEVIGDTPFAFGDEPRVFDCGLWAHLMQPAQSPAASKIREAVRVNTKLTDYVDRVAERAKIELPPRTN